MFTNTEFSPSGPEPPVPKPRARPNLAHCPAPLPVPTRPGIVVQATQPFAHDNGKEMIQWLLGAKVGGQEEVRNVELSQDRLSAYVEFVDPRVISQLLSGDVITDPLTKQPLQLAQVDLMDIWPPCVLVRGFPPFVDSSLLMSHFEGVAGNQEIRSVHVSNDKEFASIIYAPSTVAFDVVSKKTELFGCNLQLELSYYGPQPAGPSQDHPSGEASTLSPRDQQSGERSSLCVQGLPQEMMSNLSVLQEALKCFIKKTTDYEPRSCEVVEGVGYVTFDDVLAVQSIVANPPTKTFLAGSVLHMLATLKTTPSANAPTMSNPQVPPKIEGRSPIKAWEVIAEQNTGNSPTFSQEKSTTAPVGHSPKPPIPARRRNVSDSAMQNPADKQYYSSVTGGVPTNPDLTQNQWMQQIPTSGQGQLFMNPTSSVNSVSHNSSSVTGHPTSKSGYQQQQVPPSYPPVHAMSTGNIANRNLPTQQHNPVHWMQQGPSASNPQFHIPNQYAPSKQDLGAWQSSDHRPMFYVDQSTTSHTNPGESEDHLSPHQGQIEDSDKPRGQNVIGSFGSSSRRGLCTKVLISDIPAEARHVMTLQYYLKTIVQGAGVCVELHGSQAVATFDSLVDLEQLTRQAREFESGPLTISKLEPPVTILVTNIKEDSSDSYLKLACEQLTEKFETVANIERLSSTMALVTFKSHDYVQKVLSKVPFQLEGVQVSAKEHYPFLSLDLTDSFQPSPSKEGGPSPQIQSAQHIWCVQREQLTKEQSFYLQHSISEINENLETLKACAEIEQDGKDKWVVTKPLEGSGAIADWETKVATVHKEHFARLCIETIAFPKDAKAEVLDYMLSISADHPQSVQILDRGKETIVVAGRKEIIDNIREEVSEISQPFQFVKDTIDLPRKHIKFLERFYLHDIQKLQADAVDFQFDHDAESITVTANPQGHEKFKELFQQLKTVHEKTLPISASAHKLLSFTRGPQKMTEIFGLAASQLVYDFEQTEASPDDPPNFQVCLLSRDKEVCKEARKKLKLYVYEEGFTTTPTKIRVCSNKQWRDLVSKLTEEFFVAITAQEDTATITVTGEKIVCSDIVTKIKGFLAEHTNIEERVDFSKHEWKVVHTNFKTETSGVKDQAKQKNVKVVWPDQNSSESSLPVIIQGEPGDVDDIKVQVSMVKMKVCKKEARITGVPAVVQVLESIEDRIRVLAANHKASIDVCLENGDTNGAMEGQAAGELPRKVCIATAPNGCRVSIFTGDSTQHQPAGVIVNFVTPDPNPQVGHLKFLMEAGGPNALSDFTLKVSQFMELKPTNVFKTKQGQLKCSQLLHCVLPMWKNGESEANKEYFLEDTLQKAFRDASMYGSILIMPLTPVPFCYPINVFVKHIMEALSSGSVSSDLQVAVYVEELHHAQEFEEMFRAKKFQVHTSVPIHSPLLGCKMEHKTTAAAATAKTIASPISTFITLVNGDLLEQQAEVYINSTNTNMDLKMGQLSKLLLKACGDDLQRECSEYAPLKPGQVAVTGAKNLKCQHIFHIALPDYKTTSSERLFRETVQRILRIAKDKSVSSIAFPSLGVANLRYPASVSARILFQEVVAFHARFPNSIQKFVFVIYEKSVFQSFSKEYAQQMSDGTRPQASHDPSSAAVPTQTGKSSPQPTGSTRLKIVQGNIAEESTDIIVNTTTEDMNLSKTAVSKAILKKAGDQLQTTCTQFVENGMKLDHGQTVSTPAFGRLQCKKVVHAHVPPRSSMSRSSFHHSKLIEEIVQDCLQKAENDRMQSISFPAFGLGGGGYSVDEVAEPMLNALKTFGQSHPKSIKMIRVVIYDQALYDMFNKFYCKFFDRDVSAPPPPVGLFSRWRGNSHKSDYDTQELQDRKGSPAAQVTSVALPRSISNPVAVFQIFASSDAKCSQIADELKEAIKVKAVTESIKDAEIIEHLIDDDIRDIKAIEGDLGVQIKLMTKIKEIHISGEKAKVLEAQLKIRHILTEVERSKNELKAFEWQSEDNGEFESYPPEASIRLERAHNKKLRAIELIVDGVAVVIDLQENMETSKTTGKRRQVRRTKNMMASVDFPKTWGPEDKKGSVHMFDVAPGTQEYIDAVREFEESLNKYNHTFTIEKVQRIQNRIEYSKHVALRDSIQEKYHKKVLVKRLFHGSNQESLQLIAVQGFNRNYAADANAAYFGKGVYFAVESSYSAQEKYAKPDSSGLQYMFVCSVSIGEYTKGTQSMKGAPPLTPGGREVYDTLVDNEKAPTIFVAMSDAQAYPEYLITFKIDKIKKK